VFEEDRVPPGAVLEAHLMETTGLDETGGAMQTQGGGRCAGVGDDSDEQVNVRVPGGFDASMTAASSLVPTPRPVASGCR